MDLKKQLENQLWTDKNQIQVILIKEKMEKLPSLITELQKKIDEFDELKSLKEYRSIIRELNAKESELGMLKNSLKELTDKEYFDYLEVLRNDF